MIFLKVLLFTTNFSCFKILNQKRKNEMKIVVHKKLFFYYRLIINNYYLQAFIILICLRVHVEKWYQKTQEHFAKWQIIILHSFGSYQVNQVFTNNLPLVLNEI